MLLVLSLTGAGALCVAISVLAELSRRLGEVTRQSPRYGWFYLSAALIGVGTGAQLIAVLSIGTLDAAVALIYDVPLVVGLLIAVVTTVYYWGWLFGERGRTPEP
jgi:hypothetical protein